MQEIYAKSYCRDPYFLDSDKSQQDTNVFTQHILITLPLICHLSITEDISARERNVLFKEPSQEI